MEEGKKIKKTAIGNPMMSVSRVKQWFKSKPPFKKVLIILAGIGIVFVLYIVSVLVRYNDLPINGKTNTEEQGTSLNEDLSKKRFESFTSKESGLVCFGDNHFSFQIGSEYKILSDDSKGIALFTNSSLVTVSANDKNIVETLKDLEITYRKNGDIYFYKVQSGKSYGVSQEKNGMVVSVFSSRADDKDSLKILSDVVLSLKEGCSQL